MHGFLNTAFQRPAAGAAAYAFSHSGPGEEAEEDQDGLELPVNPDQGTPLIPNEEGVITVPT